jgi:hypothetical protein
MDFDEIFKVKKAIGEVVKRYKKRKRERDVAKYASKQGYWADVLHSAPFNNLLSTLSLVSSTAQRQKSKRNKWNAKRATHKKIHSALLVYATHSSVTLWTSTGIEESMGVLVVLVRDRRSPVVSLPLVGISPSLSFSFPTHTYLRRPGITLGK